MEKQPSSQYRIDENVFITISLVALVSLLILAFRFTTAEPCEPVNILVKASDFVEGTLVSFKAETRNGKTYLWNFGDGSKQEQAGSSVTHVYKNPGAYTIAVLVNGNCDAVTTVTIKAAPIVINTDLQPDLRVPDSAFINQPVHFRDMTRDAISWEWRFGESNQIDATDQEPVYTYQTPGVKEVLLKINGRPDRVAVRIILVKDPNPTKRVEPGGKRRGGHQDVLISDTPATGASTVGPVQTKDTVDKKPPKEIPVAQVETFLRHVIAGDQSAADFSQFLCNNIKLSVKLNDEEMPFDVMCKKLEKIRSRRVKDLDFTVTQENGCITSLDVRLKKRKI